MATKPTSLPRWATDGAAEITVPSSGKMDLGWEDGELPPHDYFNWQGNLTYQWLLWASDEAFSPRWRQFGHVYDAVTSNVKPYLVSTPTNETLHARLPLEVGEHFTSVRVRVADDGLSAGTARLWSFTSAGPPVAVTAASNSNSTGAMQTITLAAVDVTVVAGTWYYVEILHTGGGFSLFEGEVLVNRVNLAVP